MRTSRKAKDAAAEKQSYACDTLTGHGKAHQPPLPGSTVRVFPVMLPGKADEGAAVDLVRGGGGGDAPGPAAGCRVNRGPVALVSGVALISGNPAGWNVTSGRLPARIRGQVMYPRPVHGAGIPCMPRPGRDPCMSARGR
jgi:hypothetical protein